MSYPSPDGRQPAPYGYGYPPVRRRRGLKRIILGSIGLVANLIGLVLMPVIAGFIALLVVAVGATSLTSLEPGGDTIAASGMSAYVITVPADELDQVSCDITGPDISVEPADDVGPLGQLDGDDHVGLYQVVTLTEQQIEVQCEGASALGVSEMGMLGVFVSAGIGLVLPVLLGIASLVLLIWGIIARVRS